jgi:hypothetical protein
VLASQLAGAFPLIERFAAELDARRSFLEADQTFASECREATARKLALLVYRVLAGKLVYQDPGAAGYHQLNRNRERKWLRKLADLLGFDLIDRATGEVLLQANPVSQAVKANCLRLRAA